MNNLRLTVFDIFSYIVPGLCYIIVISIGINLISIKDLPTFINELSIFPIVAYCFIAYLIGFTFDAIAGGVIIFLSDFLFGNLKEKVILNFNRENPENKIKEYHFSHIYSYATINAEKAREKADQYSAMSGLARNLSLAFLIFTIANSCYTIACISTKNWLFFFLKIFIWLVVSCILMYRSYSFRKWSHGHLLDVYHMLNLKSLD